MSKTAVVYWSGTGNTEAMAAAVADGVKTAGGEATLFSAGGRSGGLAVYGCGIRGGQNG